MADLRTKVEVEIENIQRALAGLPAAEKLTELSPLELAGVAALLHSIYNGMGNILKQILLDRNIPLSSGASWHRDLLEAALKNDIISNSTRDAVAPYLAFRHFFSHAHALDLNSARMEPLVADVHGMVSRFKENVEMAVRSSGS